MSNKLTFSLALVVMLALIAGPALAQTATTHALDLSGVMDGDFVVITNTDGVDQNGILAAVTTQTQTQQRWSTWRRYSV